MRKILYMLQCLGVILFFTVTGNLLIAQTTGKIAGKVVDSETGAQLPGTNVLIVNTDIGAAADEHGDFYIINLKPGLYTLRIQMIGYEAVIVRNLRVSVNRTSYVDIKMNQTVLKGQAVIVEAEKVTIKKDQTGTIKNISSDQIDILPVESITAVVSMQAGVVVGHFRGGRSTEVSYLIDGMQVDESFDGVGRAVDLETEVVEDLEVITGTFNAEYGNAMSGIVNMVTKDGGNEFHGSVSADVANFFTPNKDIFIGLEDTEFDRNQDYKFHLSGPIINNRLNFFVNYRFQNNKNHLNGIRRFNVYDFSDWFSSDNPEFWYSEHTGDSAYVAMNRSINKSFMGKLTTRLFRNLKLSLLYILNNDEWHSYDHAFKYNPDGMAASYRKSNMYALQMNHLVFNSLFYELKLSYLNNYSGWYVYENPLDSLYEHDAYFSADGPGFYTGGQQKGHNRRTIDDRSAKFDLNWQLNRTHSLKTGFLYTHYTLNNQYSNIQNYYTYFPDSAGNYVEYEWEWVIEENRMKIEFPYYQPVISPDSSVYSDIYKVYPTEFSAYIQDKMEFDEMVINFGIRYDYFDPNTYYPSQRRNPSNQSNEYLKDENGNLIYDEDGDVILDPDRMSTYIKIDPKFQVSPRFGLSYQLGKTAVLHFSYGHFFQTPPMYALYQNHAFRVAPTDYETTMGNAQIKAEKTVSYEIGLWQEIMDGMDIEVTLFYRDIYDLLSAKVISTFSQIEYGLYSNKDYGNVRGLEVKYDFVKDHFSAYVNYTLQYTRGNADDPVQTFNRAGENTDPITRLIPMSWDQRHTFNVTVGYNTAKYGATLTGYYNSGTPYTWRPTQGILERVTLYPNNTWISTNYSVDLHSYYNIHISKNVKLKLTLSVYNLLDRLNEVWVNDQTGRAYTAIIRETNLLRHRSDFNEYKDIVQNPAMYSAPCLVKIGLGLTF